MCQQTQPNTLRNYYIAYIDILGYKDFFDTRSDEIPSFLQTIYTAFDNVKDSIKAINSSVFLSPISADIKWKCFSDNILICMETGTSENEIIRLLVFLSLIADIQRNMIFKYHLFFRGGITCGQLSFNNDFVFGQGLIKAANMEQDAIFPRILVDTNIKTQLENWFTSSREEASKIQTYLSSLNLESNSEPLQHIQQRIQFLLFTNQWRQHIYMVYPDNKNILNYLYNLNANTLLEQSIAHNIFEALQKLDGSFIDSVPSRFSAPDILNSHKKILTEMLNKYGTPAASCEPTPQANIREKILRKYLWLTGYHNTVCTLYNHNECLIYPKINCDIASVHLQASVESPSVE